MLNSPKPPKPNSSFIPLKKPMLQSTAPTTANEAIKLALAKLAERGNERHDDTTRVSNLAQQLAKVTIGFFCAESNFL